MDKNELRYIHTINRHISGPIKNALQGSRLVQHMPAAINATLSRLIAAAELAPVQSHELRTIARKHLTTLTKVFHADENALIVDQLKSALSAEAPKDHDIEKCLSKLMMSLGNRSDEISKNICSELINQDWLRLQQLEKAYQDLEGETPVGTEDPNSNGLSEQQKHELIARFQKELGESENLSFQSCSVVLGGFSKQTILADLANNSVLPGEIVIRLDRPESPTNKSVITEFPLLQLLYKKGIKVPRPWLLDAEGSITGNPFMITSKTSGSVIADGHHFFEGRKIPGLAVDLAAELAKIHTIPVEELPPSVPGRESSNEASMRADLEKLRKMWDACGRFSISVEAAFSWLFSHIDRAGEQRTLVHGDMRFQNLIVEADAVASILDWELAAIGNPGFDLGYVYHHVVQLADWQLFIDAYAAAGGIIPSDETLRFYALRTELFALVHLAKLESGFLAGQFEKIDLAYASIHLGQHNMYLLAKRLVEILNKDKL